MTRTMWIAVAVLQIAALSGCREPRGEVVRTLDESESLRATYLAEFEAWKSGIDDSLTAPDGSAILKWEDHGGGILLDICDPCHTLWLCPNGSRCRRVVTAVEGDPCSGMSFGAKWSADSRALFLKGWYSGLGCRWPRKYSDAQNMALIYTVSDGQLWAVSESESSH